MPVIYTIGHWVNPIHEFVQMLQEHDIELLVDIRSYPGSSTSPQYNKEVLPAWLDEAGIKYMHMPGLGGRKRGWNQLGPNNGWNNESFGSYADYSESETWKRTFKRLKDLGIVYRVCYMCGEPHPARCHRNVVSNTMTIHGFEVYHIIREKLSEPAHLVRHELGLWGATPVVKGDHIIYPSPDGIQATLGL